MKKLIIFFLITFIFVGCTNKEYTIAFNTNGGSLIESQIILAGDMVNKPINPTKDGYTFVNWEYNKTKYDFKTKVKKDMVLDAIWTTDANITKCSIEFENGETKKTEEVNFGEVIKEPNAPYKNGYKFIGWHLDGEDEPYNFDQIVTCDIKLIAKYQEDSSSSLTGNDTIFITSLESNVEKTILIKNESIQINTIILPDNATNKNLVYETTNKRIATVSDTGLITAIRAGEVTINIKSTDDSGFSNTIDLIIVNE